MGRYERELRFETRSGTGPGNERSFSDQKPRRSPPTRGASGRGSGASSSPWRGGSRPRWSVILLLALGFLSTGREGRAEEPERVWEVGVRSGVSASSFDDTFVQAEAFSFRTLPQRFPWRLETDFGWYSQMRLGLSMGWLHGQQQEGWVGTLGPSLKLGKRGSAFSLDVGSSPTGLSRSRFGTTDFGTKFQFTSHAGVSWDIGPHLILGYRIQHMSNARLNHHNPGLDLHALTLGWRF